MEAVRLERTHGSGDVLETDEPREAPKGWRRSAGVQGLPCPRSSPSARPSPLFGRLGSESMFSFRKSDPAEAEAQGLGFCRQPSRRGAAAGRNRASWAQGRSWAPDLREARVEVGGGARENEQEVWPSLPLSRRGSDFC